MNFNVNSFLAQGEQQRATYRDERRAEEKELIERQDAGIFEITGNPEQYIQYLEMQARNIRYSPGNNVLIMQSNPQAGYVFSKAFWRKAGRNVSFEEERNAIRILRPKEYEGIRKDTFISEQGEYFAAGERYSGKSNQIHFVYDESQTVGTPYKAPTSIGENETEKAALFQNLYRMCSAPIKSAEDIPSPAVYDPQTFTIYIRPDLDESQFFAALSGECVQASLHNYGKNREYRYEDFTLDAASISYMLCKRYGIDAEPPGILSEVGHVYDGLPIEDRRFTLNANQELTENMTKRLEWGLNRQAEKTRRVTPTRRQGAR